jgi:two-component system response regulator
MNFESVDLGVGITAEGSRFVRGRRRMEQCDDRLDGARQIVLTLGPFRRAWIGHHELRGRALVGHEENLLDNAWKFTSKAPTARIEFGATEKDGSPAFFVRDNGCTQVIEFPGNGNWPCDRAAHSAASWGPHLGRKGVVDGGRDVLFRISRAAIEINAMHKVILLVEDNASDEKLTLLAFKKCGVSNEVVVVRDGASALDYIFGTGKHAGRDPSALPSVVLLDLKLSCQRSTASRFCAPSEPTNVRSLCRSSSFTASKEDEDVLRGYSLGSQRLHAGAVEICGVRGSGQGAWACSHE